MSLLLLFRNKVAAASYTTMADIDPSAVFDLDSAIADSYGGTGQTWANLITAPSDGASQTDYDFYLGGDGSSGTNDPTFTGTAGDSGAYWSFDGGDYFSLASSSIPDFLAKMSVNGEGRAWTICIAYRHSASFQILYSNNANSSSNGVEIGADLVTDDIRLTVDQTAGAATVDTVGNNVTDNTDLFIAISVDIDAGTANIWVNSVKESFTPTFFSGVTASTDKPYIGARTGGSLPMRSGTRMYGFSAFNSALGDSEIASVMAEYESRHGITF